MLTCTACGLAKPVADFYMRAPGQPRRDCKDCVKARSAQRRVEKPTEVAATRDAWALRNPERVKKIKRAYYERNREQIIIGARQWVLDHPEQRAATWQQWYDENPQSRHLAAQKRRATKAGADTRVITDWDRTVRRFAGLCAYCRQRPWRHRDHVVPISRGGRHSIGNLLPACAPCNQSKKDKTLTEWGIRVTAC